MKHLEAFRTGFPQYQWGLFFDKQLKKQTIIRLDSDAVNEIMPSTNKLRYLKIKER